MAIAVRPCRLEDLSPIEVRYQANGMTRWGEAEVLIVSFEGTYRPGSAGSPDARYMLAMTDAAIAAWEPRGLILDLSQLRYKWGDDLEHLVPYDGGRNADCVMPSALVVGRYCEEAIRTLIFGERGMESIESIEWIFRELHPAWSYVVKRIPKHSISSLEPPAQ